MWLNGSKTTSVWPTLPRACQGHRVRSPPGRVAPRARLALPRIRHPNVSPPRPGACCITSYQTSKRVTSQTWGLLHYLVSDIQTCHLPDLGPAALPRIRHPNVSPPRPGACCITSYQTSKRVTSQTWGLLHYLVSDIQTCHLPDLGSAALPRIRHPNVSPPRPGACCITSYQTSKRVTSQTWGLLHYLVSDIQTCHLPDLGPAALPRIRHPNVSPPRPGACCITSYPTSKRVTSQTWGLLHYLVSDIQTCHLPDLGPAALPRIRHPNVSPPRPGVCCITSYQTSKRVTSQTWGLLHYLVSDIQTCHLPDLGPAALPRIRHPNVSPPRPGACCITSYQTSRRVTSQTWGLLHYLVSDIQTCHLPDLGPAALPRIRHPDVSPPRPGACCITSYQTSKRVTSQTWGLLHYLVSDIQTCHLPDLGPAALPRIRHPNVSPLRPGACCIASSPGHPSPLCVHVGLYGLFQCIMGFTFRSIPISKDMLKNITWLIGSYRCFLHVLGTPKLCSK